MWNNQGLKHMWNMKIMDKDEILSQEVVVVCRFKKNLFENQIEV